jgi:hypothetical protein
MLAATGAAQHAHIIDGMDSAPPATVLTADPRCPWNIDSSRRRRRRRAWSTGRWWR